MTNLTRIRKTILKKRGLISTRDSALRQHSLHPESPPSSVHKTGLMLFLEVKYGADIVDLVSEGSVREIAKKLHPYVDYSTISKWKKQFGMEVDER